MESLRKLPPVALYAIAMAYVEAAAVSYLREMRDIDNLLDDLPSDVVGGPARHWPGRSRWLRT